jgi:hypothetical protein
MLHQCGGIAVNAVWYSAAQSPARREFKLGGFGRYLKLYTAL